MLDVLKTSWALFLGMLLLMMGNGLQGTLLGVRGDIEGFTTFDLSLITSGYFLGFLGGTMMAPGFIRRVGHVRVFAALGSFISAALILYPALTDPWAWIVLRVIIGFCFSGVYVTAESWLNNASSNDNRGKSLSLYMIVQMAGIVTGQGLMNVADPGGFILFIIPSVLVSISFAPILLSVSPTPSFETNRNMSLADLYKVSPLGFIGMFLLGGIFSAQFGMSAVYGTLAGLSVAQISVFVSAIFVGALFMQYPIGWISDRMDRRVLIMWTSALGAMAAAAAMMAGNNFTVLLVAAFLVGGTSNPLYSLLLAYTNDYLESEDMAAASAGLLFVNGLGAITGPLIIGWVMTRFGPSGFWSVIMMLLAAVVVYGVYRSFRRASSYANEDEYEAVPYAVVVPGSSPVVAEVAQEYFADAAEEIAESGENDPESAQN